ncbi:MAG TPA: DJ-1/PfpI family protein [Elusimicrobiota bacterium]|nr:DJ-1/PfpI family protein [Elusimicrobiota bacterium]
MNNLSGLRVATLATDGFEESELAHPVRAPREAGAQVDLVSIQEGSIWGVRHLEPSDSVNVDRVLEQGLADGYDAVLLPGGPFNADLLRIQLIVQSFLQNIEKAKKPIAAICHAPWELVSAGLVKGRILTSYHTIQDDIRNASSDPRPQTAKIRNMIAELMNLIREDGRKVGDPEATTLFEATAEVLSGLDTAFYHYE